MNRQTEPFCRIGGFSYQSTYPSSIKPTAFYILVYNGDKSDKI